MRRRRAGAVVLALVVLSGCGGDDDGPGSEAGAVPLSAVATRSSLFESRRAFRLELTNTGGRVVAVRSVQLVSPRFEPVPAQPRSTELAPGQTLLLPVAYGPPTCPADGVSSLRVVVDGEGAVVPLGQDPAGVVDALHAAECAEAGVREAVDLGFGAGWEVAGPTSARGPLTAVARAGAEAVVHSLQGNIVFGVRVPDGDLLAVTSASPEASVPVTAVIDRCDTHALIESKRTFQFPAEVSVDGAEPVRVVLEPEGEVRALLQSRLEACIAGAGNE